MNDTLWCIKTRTCMHYIDRALTALIITVKSGHVEHYFQLFNTTALHYI